MKRPLIVYLDSSDFSDLSDPNKRTSEIVDIEQKLINWQDQGLIELRFSYVHVIEAAATEHRYSDLASNRFLQMKRLCGFNCLVDPMRILELEAKNLSKYKNLESINFFNDVGDWFPEIDSLKDSVSIEGLILEQINLISDRKSRRLAFSNSFKKDGKLKDKVRSNFFKTTSLVDDIAHKFPIPRSLIETAVRSYYKTGSVDSFLQALKESLANLNNLGFWYERDWDRISPISTFLREIGSDFKQSLMIATDSFHEITESQIGLGLNKNLISNLANNSFNNLIKNLPNDFANKLAVTLGVDLIKEPTWELAPSLVTMGTVGGYVGKFTALSGRKAKVSDFGDIYHVAYLPYVDIFRADGFISSAIDTAKLPFDTKVMERFVELPEAIQEMLLI